MKRFSQFGWIPALAVSAGLLLLTVGALVARPRDKPMQPQPAAAPYEYLLRAQGERLALYEYGEGAWRPKTTFTARIDDLPGGDRAVLEQGLVLRDDTELQRALEDYLPG